MGPRYIHVFQVLSRLNGKNRALAALDLEEPDLVPQFEIIIDPPVIEAITGETLIRGEDALRHGRDQTIRLNSHIAARCYRMIGIDMIGVLESPPRDTRSEPLGNDGWIDEWGRAFRYKEGIEWYSQGTIKRIEDLKNLQKPDPLAPGRLDSLKIILNELGDSTAIVGVISEGWETAYQMTGLENMMRFFYVNPELVVRLIDMVVDYNIGLLQAMADTGVDAILGGDDYASQKGPLVSQRHFEQFILPGLRRIVDATKKHGLPFIKHCDGYIMPMLDSLISVGIDGLHSMEPIAGMNLGEVKSKYGADICLLGNVDCSHTLCTKSPSDVAQEVRDCIEQGAPGGGYFLSSSNTIHTGVNVENYFAMIEAGRKYGRYSPAGFT